MREVRVVEGVVDDGVSRLVEALRPTTVLGTGRALAVLAGAEAGGSATAGWAQGGDRAEGIADPRFWVLDIPPDVPGAEPPHFHDTPSVDFGFVLDGEVILEVEGGERTVLRQGEAFIQRGAPHRWLNDSGRLATIGIVMVEAS